MSETPKTNTTRETFLQLVRNSSEDLPDEGVAMGHCAYCKKPFAKGDVALLVCTATGHTGPRIAATGDAMSASDTWDFDFAHQGVCCVTDLPPTKESGRAPAPDWIPRETDERPSDAMPSPGNSDWREEAEWWRRTCEYWHKQTLILDSRLKVLTAEDRHP